MQADPKRQRVGCGLVRVRLQRPDADLEPDESMVESKVSLIRSLGLQVPEEYELCACPGEGKDMALPLGLLTTLRVFAMTETELYFTPSGKGEKIEEDIPCASARNEIRALTHLSNLLSAQEPNGCLVACKDAVVSMLLARTRVDLPQDEGKPVQDAAEAAACEEFEQWCGENGVSAALQICEFAGTGRGMAASRDVAPGETIVSTPHYLFLNTEDIQSSRFAHIFMQVKGLDERSMHILMVLMERGDVENSPWKSYLKSCPQEVLNGLLFTDEELQILQGSPALDCLVERRTELFEMYTALFPKLSDAFPKELAPEKSRWEDFLWAAALIDTRAWATEAGSEVSSLVPCVDMMNHHRSAQGMVKKYNADVGAATVELLVPVKKGQQVFIYYGELTTASQLLRFGFVDDDDPCDTVPFELDMEGASDLQQNAMSAWGLRPDATQLLRRHGPLSQRMLAMLRVLHLDAGADRELLSAVAAKERDPRWMLTQENEEAVSGTLVSLVEALQSAYSTQLEDDVEQLRSASIGWAPKACLSHLVSQKRVLRDSLNLAQALLQ